MELVTKMFGRSIPIIGFLMVREGTGKEELLGYTHFLVFVQSTYIGVNLNSKRFGNYCDPNEKDENNFWKNRRRKNCYRLAKPEFQC